MKRTRRAFLAVVGTTSVAGCSDTSGVNYPDVADEDSDESTNEDTSTNSDETEENGSEEPKQIKNELLARGTRRVVADSLWFATEYRQSIK